MSVGLDVFVINVAFAHQVLSSLFSVPLVAVGILFLTFQKSMTNNPARTKIVSFSGESLHLFLYIFSFGKMFLMRSACLISWAFANSFSIFGFSHKSPFCILNLSHQIFVWGSLKPHQVQYSRGLYLKILLLHSILFHIS